MSRDPGMYLDSRQIFDSPVLFRVRLHWPHRWYGSVCSSSRLPGLRERNLSSASRDFFNSAALSHSSSKRFRDLKRRSYLSARSSRSLSTNKYNKLSLVIKENTSEVCPESSLVIRCKKVDVLD